VALVGPNGAGKSTLLWHLNGLLPGRAGGPAIHSHAPKPSSSTSDSRPSVQVDGLVVDARNGPEVRRRVGLLFQDPDDQLFMPTVYDDVAFGPMNLGLSGAELERCVKSALERVGAGHLVKKAPYHLSGGEKKRVAIATVLSMSPDILVMDEPTNGLDPHARRQLIGLLKDFSHTKIFTSHDLDMVLELCERTIILKGGEVRADGPTREIFQNDALLAECRLEKPLSMQGCAICGSAFETVQSSRF
jgi:cobalt/nickel transport system ATP-binding protein